jgi:hypothetical protein
MLKLSQWRLAVLLSLVGLLMTACGLATPTVPTSSNTVVQATATSLLPAAGEPPPSPTMTPTSTITPTSTPSPTLTPPSQTVQVQLDPPQAEPGQPVTVHVEGLPLAVASGKDMACVDLKQEEDRSVAGPIGLSPSESGGFVARLTFPDHLAPGAYRLTVFICGTTLETPPESESTPPSSPPLPLPLITIPYTITARTTQFGQVERISSPDGRWTALVNAMAGSLDLQGPGGEIFVSSQ